MDWMSLAQWFAGIIQLIIALVLGALITGIFTWKLVLPKALANKEVQDLVKTAKEGKEAIENFFESDDWQDMVQLFREGKELLKEVLEKQKEMGKRGH